MHVEIITVAGQRYCRAAWSRRLLAQMIDLALVFGTCVVAGQNLVLALLMLPVSVAYIIIGCGLLHGATLGKRLCDIKVIDAQYGVPCSVIQDFLRHRYLLFANPVFLLFMAYDSAQGTLDQPETYVVRAVPLPIAEVEVPQGKPARLDLSGMRDAIQKIRDAHNDAGPHD